MTRGERLEAIRGETQYLLFTIHYYMYIYEGQRNTLQ